ncbi:inositol monophosphatase family protein [Streptomyces sp. CB01881]|uniref:inositol monophosphatase family protein n=1 Tax=Streptomyces sp. CB01881 TaxID=2078691 RepID=UPI000CDC6BC9|nr:inositol monophosphatase family protein [Streptomyces sp. CB01881]AUY51946.1 inositol monophosphatase [Streptomyces sp. CB01881]TYC71378.1 inositol monophosphatase [Streptomyces sp. CB01881]
MNDEVQELKELLPAVEAAVREVGARLAEMRPAEPTPGRTVAEAMAHFAELDGPAAALLRARLGELRPQAGWVTDELEGSVPAEGEWWLCDATDGAVQYLLGLPHWAVTATLVRDGAAVLAVVHAPQLGGRTYRAVRGGGAELDGRAVAPLERELAVAVAGTSQPPSAAADRVALRRAGESLTAVLGSVLAVRNLGPTSLQVAQVASGHLGLFWEYGADAGNLLPGALIAAEAGATVTDAVGAAWTAGSDGFLAAAPGLHGDVLKVLRSVG